MADLDSIKQFVDEIKNEFDHLDYLINNAGLFSSNYEETLAGFEFTVGVNYLGSFLLTHLLITLLEKPNCTDVECKSRIINISSKANYSAPTNLDSLFYSKNNYSSWGSYSNSKLFNAMHAVELSRQYQDKGIIAVSLHPGLIKTNFFSNFNIFIKVN